MKFLHFTKYPDIQPMTRKERIENRKALAHDLNFMKIYAFTLFLFFFSLAIGSKMFWSDDLEILHDEICASSAKSPLCSDYKLLERIDIIAKKKNVPTRLIVGIWNAESSVGTNFNKNECSKYNNWAWLKWKMDNNGNVTMYAVNRKKPDANWCYLYRFDSVEKMTESLSNTLSIGYKWCNMDVRCISRAYVWDPEKEEQSWINNVWKYYPKK